MHAGTPTTFSPSPSPSNTLPTASVASPFVATVVVPVFSRIAPLPTAIPTVALFGSSPRTGYYSHMMFHSTMNQCRTRLRFCSFDWSLSMNSNCRSMVFSACSYCCCFCCVVRAMMISLMIVSMIVASCLVHHHRLLRPSDTS